MRFNLPQTKINPSPGFQAGFFCECPPYLGWGRGLHVGRLLKDSSARGARGRDQGVSADLAVLPNFMEPGQTGRVRVSSGHAAAHVGFMKVSGAWLPGARCRGCYSVRLEDAGLWAPPLFPPPPPRSPTPSPSEWPAPGSHTTGPKPGGFRPRARRLPSLC